MANEEELFNRSQKFAQEVRKANKDILGSTLEINDAKELQLDLTKEAVKAVKQGKFEQADELKIQGHEIEKRQVILKSVIKNIGHHEVRVVIHPEFIINISVNIARTLEELTMKSEEIADKEQKEKEASEMLAIEQEKRNAAEITSKEKEEVDNENTKKEHEEENIE